MALYWLSGQDPDETGFFQVDWADEMTAAGDTITGTPTFASVAGAAVGVTFGSVAIATGSKKVNVLISNANPTTNRVAALAASPITDIVHKVTTASGQTLYRTLSLIIAEDGSDLTATVSSATADVYDTLAAADLYHVNLGHTDWAGTDLERARMMRRGTASLDERFRMRLQGIRTTSGQALAWPRHGVVDEDGNGLSSATIPAAVKRASFEMGRITSMEMVATGGQRIRSAGAGSARVEFASGYQVDTTLSHVDRLMAPYLKSGNRLVRA